NADGTADGTLSWTALKTGTYTLHEDQAPTGYHAVADQTFVIQDTAADAHHGPDLSATINDPVTPVVLTIRKTDKSDPPVRLAGATFELFQVHAGGDISQGTCITGNGSDVQHPL